MYFYKKSSFYFNVTDSESTLPLSQNCSHSQLLNLNLNTYWRHYAPYCTPMEHSKFKIKYFMLSKLWSMVKSYFKIYSSINKDNQVVKQTRKLEIRESNVVFMYKALKSSEEGTLAFSNIKSLQNVLNIALIYKFLVYFKGKLL